MAMQAASSISPSEPPSRAFSDDDRSDHGGRMQQPPKQEVPPTADPNNRAMFYNDMSPRNEMKRDMPMQPQQQLQQPPQQQLQQQQQLSHEQQLQQQAQQQLPQQIQQQPQQQLQPQLQQQAQQQPPQPQQAHQPAPQQYVTAGNQHFIHNPATGTFIPIQSYYQQTVPQQAPQQQQSPAFDPNTGMYYIPMQRPNAPQRQYMKPELQQPGMYRTAAPAAAAPGPNTTPNYAGMGYHHVMQSHHHPASQPPPTMAGNYGYPEYAADPRAQVFYSQAGAPPASLPPQYQQPMGAPDAGGQADMNQNRGGS
ncbi:hypothetical protein TRIUR3_16756 [Triticum urartu]|uniref:Uncharacterized protein n=1 Tax=Triticum urartu TaxID=4572 RepID=M7Y945_TRIUA|nr:hypothetical protein TRIUR3_16756 [Triticum urartu]